MGFWWWIGSTVALTSLIVGIASYLSPWPVPELERITGWPGWSVRLGLILTFAALAGSIVWVLYPGRRRHKVLLKKRFGQLRHSLNYELLEMSREVGRSPGALDSHRDILRATQRVAREWEVELTSQPPMPGKLADRLTDFRGFVGDIDAVLEKLDKNTVLEKLDTSSAGADNESSGDLVEDCVQLALDVATARLFRLLDQIAWSLSRL